MRDSVASDFGRFTARAVVRVRRESQSTLAALDDYLRLVTREQPTEYRTEIHGLLVSGDAPLIVLVNCLYEKSSVSARHPLQRLIFETG